MMRNLNKLLLLPSLFLLMTNCADDQPFMTGYIRNAFDAVMTPCDPYNTGALHTCVIYSSAFNKSLIINDASTQELVLSPMMYFPLKVKVGPATNDLVTVSNASERFPFVLALDPVLEAIFVVRTFPSDDPKEKSFATPQQQALPKMDARPYKMGAFLIKDKVALIITYPDRGSVQILSLDAKTGVISAQSKTLKVGTRPSHVALLDNKALISDEGANDIHVIDLSEIDEVWQGNKNLVATSFPVGMKTKSLFAAARDFGRGLKNYVALLEYGAMELKLFNSSDNVLEASLTLTHHPSALYFPDQKSAPCCDGEKNWLAVVGTKGHLTYISIKEAGGGLQLKEAVSSDLTSAKNMGLSQLRVQKLIGGKVIFDPSLKREKQCPPNNRIMFIIASFGRDQSFFTDLIPSGGNPVEAQGWMCEGEKNATLLGTVDNEPRARVAVQQ